MPSILGDFKEFTPESSLKRIGIPRDPYMFTSTTQIESHPEKTQRIVEKLRKFFENPTELIVFKKQHRENEIPLTKEEYTTLHKDNQYLAWYITNYLAVNCASNTPSSLEPLNHFAYTLNQHPTYNSCEKMNTVLEQNKLKINEQKGQKVQITHYPNGDKFEQSSTLSTSFDVLFLGNKTKTLIPGAFEEPVFHPEKEEFGGFINAAGLFSSTEQSQAEKKKSP